MRIKIFLAIFFMASTTIALATDISFVVYYAKGQVTKNSNLKIKKGDKILSTEGLRIGDNSAVMLVCSNYKVIQINKKGTYTAKNLLSQCNTNAEGYSSSYFKYVWDEFTHPHGKPESDPGKYMKNVGAVSRGCNTVGTGISVDTLVAGKGTFSVYWKSSFDKPVLALYEVPVDGAPVQKLILEKDTPVNIETLTRSLAPGNYYWQITDTEGNSCERNYLQVLRSDAYQLKVDELTGHIPFTTEAETAFLRGFILEENHMIAAAIASYRMASILAPGNKLYSKTLSKFYATDF